MKQVDNVLQPPARSPAQQLVTLGAVDYLNTLPLITGLERLKGLRVVTDVPARLVGMLERDEVDIALCSSIDLLHCPDPLEVVPVGMLGCEGPTLTVRIFSKVPLDRIKTVACDIESHTSVQLLRVLLREEHGVEPELLDFDARSFAAGRLEAPDADAMLLIGDKVVTATVPRSFEYVEVDLGEAWYEMTELPFVFATWLCRRDADEERRQRIRLAGRILDRTRRLNHTRISDIACRRAADHGWSVDLARGYMVDYLKYDLDERAILGLRRFLELAGGLRGPLPIFDEV